MLMNDVNRGAVSLMPSVDRSLTIQQLSVRYGDRSAIKDIDFELLPGMTLAVIGPNGSGKSTLLHTIMGLLPASQGSIDLHQQSAALVLQATVVDRSLPITVVETVSIARYASLGVFRRFKKVDEDAVEDAMIRTQVDDLAQRQLHTLSGGQRQRVLLAQGLAQKAEVLLLDEPTIGLDVSSRQLVLDIVAEERTAGRTVVMATHSFDDARSCDRVLLIATQAVAFGTPSEVIQAGYINEAFGGQVLHLDDSDILLHDFHQTS